MTSISAASESKTCQHVMRIILVGESQAGKTSLINRYFLNQFVPSFMPTIGIDFRSKAVLVSAPLESTLITAIAPTWIKMQIWDTAGQERFRSITKSFYQKSNAVIIVYDVQDRKSFERVEHWIKDVYTHMGHDSFGIIIVGNTE